MDSQETIEAVLENGETIRIQATPLGGEERIANIGPFNFTDITDTVENIAKPLLGTLKKIKPRRGSLEFGLEIGVESGKLTALLVKGTGTANLKITLEWSELDHSTDS